MPDYMSMLACAVALTLLTGLSGCSLENFPTTITAEQDDINAIVNDTDREVQERRDDLLDLGLTPGTVNGLLSAERTGNQFGGTLTTAFNKVIAERFTTLTPDEVQLYSDAAEVANSALSFNLADDAALAVTEFFTDQSINTSEQILAFTDDEGNEIPAEIPDGFLTDVFVDLDPNAIVEQLP